MASCLLVTKGLRKKQRDTQPSQTCDGYTFQTTVLYRGVSLYLGSINETRLKTALSPVRLVLKVTLFLLLHCSEVFLCIWGVLTRLEALLTLPPMKLYILSTTQHNTTCIVHARLYAANSVSMQMLYLVSRDVCQALNNSAMPCV